MQQRTFAIEWDGGNGVKTGRLPHVRDWDGAEVCWPSFCVYCLFSWDPVGHDFNLPTPTDPKQPHKGLHVCMKTKPLLAHLFFFVHASVSRMPGARLVVTPFRHGQKKKEEEEMIERKQWEVGFCSFTLLKCFFLYIHRFMPLHAYTQHFHQLLNHLPPQPLRPFPPPPAFPSTSRPPSCVMLNRPPAIIVQATNKQGRRGKCRTSRRACV